MLAGGAGWAETFETLVEADFRPGPGDRPAERSAAFDADRPFLFEGLAPLYATRLVRSLFVPMRDGVWLSTDFLVPLGAAWPLPVVLSRTPYDKRRLGAEVRILAEQGFVVAVQDVRGRCESEGVYVANTGQDREDGYDTVGWLAAQPWCNGRVGAIGSSYVGETAAKLAAARHPNHRASILLFDGAYGQGGAYNGGFMQNGVAMLRALFEWTRDLVPKVSYGPPGSLDRRAWFRSPAALLYQTQPTPPVVDIDAAVGSLPVIGLVARSNGPPCDFDAMMTANAAPGSGYFQRQGFLTEADSFAAPALHVTGNEEVGGSGPRTWALMRRRATTTAARDHQHLIFAAAPHSGHRRASAHTIRGAREFGDTRFPYYRTFVDWFGHWLRDEGDTVAAWPKARWFVTGRNEWEGGPAYPPRDARPLRLHLRPGEGQRGALGRQPARAGVMRYRYDPRDPTPSTPAGVPTDLIGMAPIDRASIEARSDLLTFTTPPLARPLEVVGGIAAVLSVGSDAPDTDVVAILHEVDTAGRAIYVTHGVLRMRWRDGLERAEAMREDETYRVALDLWFANIRFGAGNRLRLHVASACFPFFDRNLNTGADNYTTTATRIATNALRFGPDLDNWLELSARGGTAGLFG